MALYLNRYSGSLAAGDRFIFTMWCLSAQELGAIHQAAIDWITTLWQGNGTDPGYGTLCTADVAVTQVSTSTINPDTGRQSTQDETSVNLPGTATGTNLPADVAIVVSERTAQATRSGRGRFYLPQPYAGVLGNDGRLATATTTTVANIAQSAYVLLQTDATPVIYSPTYRMSEPIVRIDVGDLADTQRRRENALTVARERRDI